MEYYFLRKILSLMNIVSAAMAGLTVNAAMAGLTNVCGRLWPVGNYGHVGGYGHVGNYCLWVLMADLTDVSPPPQSIVPSTPTYLLCDCSICHPEFPVCLGGEGLVFEQFFSNTPPPLLLFTSLPPPCPPLNLAPF